MKGMTLTFRKSEATGVDAFNNPTFTERQIEIQDCLVAPLQEPIDRVESAALDRDMNVVRVHLPMASSEDVSNSNFMYDGQDFRVIGKPVKFMADNTPKVFNRWDRYLRAECING